MKFDKAIYMLYLYVQKIIIKRYFKINKYSDTIKYFTFNIWCLYANKKK